MVDITKLARLQNGVVENISTSANTMVVASLKIDTTELTKTILDKLLLINSAADADGTFDTQYAPISHGHNVSDLTGTLPIANGGTNSSTALNNNRVMISSGSAIVEAAAITVDRALISNANGVPVASSITAVELSTLSGITSNIQAQLSASVSGQIYRSHVHYATTMTITSGVTTAEDIQNHAQTEGTHAFSEGQYVLSLNNNSIYVIGAGTNKVDRLVSIVTGGVTGLHGDREEAPAVGHTRLALVNLPGSPATQEVGALYYYSGSTMIVIASVSWGLATGIQLSGSYAAANGTIIPTQSVEQAISILEYKTTANATAASNAQSTANTALANAATADGKAVAAQADATQALADAATADGKAVAAQSTANTALANAATADGKAVAAQADATQALADAAAAQSDADAALSALSSLTMDAIVLNEIAGESFAGDMTYAVRLAIAGETAGRIYKATSDQQNAPGKYRVIGLAQVASAGLTAGAGIVVYKFKKDAQMFPDDAIPAASAADQGKTLWLNKDGAFSLNPKAGITVGEQFANVMVGQVREYSATINNNHIQIDCSLGNITGIDVA